MKVLALIVGFVVAAGAVYVPLWLLFRWVMSHFYPPLADVGFWPFAGAAVLLAFASTLIFPRQ